MNFKTVNLKLTSSCFVVPYEYELAMPRYGMRVYGTAISQNFPSYCVQVSFATQGL